MLLSKKLQKLSKAFQTRCNRSTTLSAEAARSLTEELNLLGRLASTMEQELAVHRLREMHAQSRSILNDETTEALVQLVADPEGKVVRPEFGRKRR